MYTCMSVYMFSYDVLSSQTANGNVEAKVVCFYRRRDISGTLIALADKHAREFTKIVHVCVCFFMYLCVCVSVCICVCTCVFVCVCVGIYILVWGCVGVGGCVVVVWV